MSVQGKSARAVGCNRACERDSIYGRNENVTEQELREIMKRTKQRVVAGLVAATAMTVGLASTSRAQGYIETGDAGSTLASAAVTSGASLPSISGSFSGLNDADLYKITISAPGSFSASTVNTITDAGGQDTALFLFSSTGTAIATNDDAASGTTVDSALPAGNTLYASLAAGTYYLGISESGNEPVNTANQLLFAGYPGGDTTAVRGAASGLNPTTESGFTATLLAAGRAATRSTSPGRARPCPCPSLPPGPPSCSAP